MLAEARGSNRENNNSDAFFLGVRRSLKGRAREFADFDEESRRAVENENWAKPRANESRGMYRGGAWKIALSMTCLHRMVVERKKSCVSSAETLDTNDEKQIKLG